MGKPVQKTSVKYSLEVIRHIITEPYETEYYDVIYTQGAYRLIFEKIYPRRLQILLKLKPNQISLETLNKLKEKFFYLEEFSYPKTIQVWFNRTHDLRFEKDINFPDITVSRVDNETDQIVGTAEDLPYTRNMSTAQFEHLKSGIKGRSEFVLTEKIDFK